MSFATGGGSHNLCASGYYGPRCAPRTAPNARELHLSDLLTQAMNNKLPEPLIVAQSVANNTNNLAIQMRAMMFINSLKSN